MTVDRLKFLVFSRKGNVSGKDQLLGKSNVKFGQFNSIEE